MKTHAQVVVIGGGVVGCSVLYHLTKRGCKDAVLLERSELTAGSTWHAAGGMHTLNSDPTVARLQKYTIELYQEIEAISGQSCGVHLTGGLMLADNAERLEYLKILQGKARVMGNDCEIVSMADAQAMHPLFDPQYFIGALFDPLEGHVDPSGVTNAYAKAARIQGAEIYRHTKVESLTQTADGGWEISTDKGTIKAEKVVNAAGLWAREVGRMVGLELPVLAMEHHYLVTEAVDAIVQREQELPHALDFAGEIYTRQEQQGFLLGTYEKNAVPWSPKSTPWDFGHELLQPDFDRIGERLDTAFKHFPFLAEAGIKQTINGPFIFAPDGNPLVGPVTGLQNFYVACAVMAGFSQGGGVGLALANWIIDGDPGMDVFAMDVARFGAFATPEYTNLRAREFYGQRFSIPYPNEVRPAGRPLRRTPVYDRLRARNAVFGASYGLEHALYFAPSGEPATEQLSFKRSNAFPAVAAECQAVRSGVGLLEISNFAKYDISGPGAAAYLDRLLANRLPKTGRLTLSPMLKPDGKLMGDLTVACAHPEQFYIFGSGAYEGVHRRWFEQHLPQHPDQGSVQVRSLVSEWTGFAIAGPRARELLSRLVWDDVSNAAFPFLGFRSMFVGMAPCKVGRISFTGELGYEIWTTADFQLALYEALLDAGEALGLCHFGGYALNSLRLEKNFGGWLREFTPDFSPFEVGLGRFVNFNKADFIGREAALKAREHGGEKALIALVVDVRDNDAVTNEAVFHAGKVVGWVTSGGYGHTVGKSIALACVDKAAANAQDFHIELLGEQRPAQRIEAPLYDPSGRKMRS